VSFTFGIKKTMKRYMIPAVIALLAIGIFFASGYLGSPRSPAHKTELESISLPHGRILYIVVDEDGIYIGKEAIPVLGLRDYLIGHRSMLKPDYAVVCGTTHSRFGNAVQAIDAIRAILKVPYMLETRALPDGTRRPKIEVANASGMPQPEE
jgi:hypothetical protein